MSTPVEFLSLGEQSVDGVPLRCVPLAEPKAAALYQRRLEAVMGSEAEYICFVDGGADICLPGFADAMEALTRFQLPLGYAAELVHGKPLDRPVFTPAGFFSDFALIHHGVVCRRKDLMAIPWPDGNYSFEVLAYGALARQGFAYDSTPRYDWRPGAGGARLWPDYPRAIMNSLLWLKGQPGKHYEGEKLHG